jgi:hypothetical protein
VDRRAWLAVIFVIVYALACVWALWSALWASLLLLAASPVAAGFLSTDRGGAGGGAGRFMLGAFIDFVMAGLAIDVPIVGDALDAGILLVAGVAMFGKIRQFVKDSPGALACVVLYVVLWTERHFLPHPSFAPGIHHPWWFYPFVVLVSAVTGVGVLAAQSAIIGTLMGKDYPRAVFAAVGYPWCTFRFIITFMVPGKRTKAAYRRTGNRFN